MTVVDILGIPAHGTRLQLRGAETCLAERWCCS